MRILTIGALMIGAAGLAAIWLAQPVPARDSWEWTTAHQERADRMELMRVQRDGFAIYVEQVYDQLANGRISLERASGNLHSYCVSFYPAYLEHVEPAETGNCVQEKIARNLLRYFHTPNGMKPQHNDPALVARLENELQTLSQKLASSEIRLTNQ